MAAASKGDIDADEGACPAGIDAVGAQSLPESCLLAVAAGYRRQTSLHTLRHVFRQTFADGALAA